MGLPRGVVLSFLPKTEIFTYRFGCVLISSNNIFKLRFDCRNSSYNFRSFSKAPTVPSFEFNLAMVISNLESAVFNSSTVSFTFVSASWPEKSLRLPRVPSIFSFLDASPAEKASTFSRYVPMNPPGDLIIA